MIDEAVLAVWRDVLGLEEVGPDDGFLELGGDSLGAIQVASRLSVLLGFEVPLLAVFDHPTPRRLAAALAGSTAAAPTRGAAGEPAELPLSFPQRRLWFLGQLDPRSAAYNAPAAWRVRGRVDADAVRRAVARLVDRHDALRTRFALRGDEPVALAAAGGPVEVELVEASGPEEAMRLASARAALPFELETADRLVRAWLVRAGAGEHLLVLGLHHAVCDGPSRAILGRDLAALYAAEVGEAPPPPAPARGYADFTRWQRAQVVDTEFWRGELAGASDALPVPTDLSRPPRVRHDGARVTLRLDRDLVRALRARCASRGVTPFMALLASFGELLRRWGGQEDVAIGVPVLGRPLPDFEGVVGHFANTVVLRLRLDGDPTFDELLDRVRAAALGAYAHQDVPFELLVSDLRPDRDLSRGPLFQVMLALQPAPPVLRAGDVELTPVDLDLAAAKLDLMAWLEASEEAIGGYLEYRTDLFRPATIERLAAQWLLLLRRALDDPGGRVRDLDVLSEADRLQLTAANRTGAAGPPDCVHRRFEAQVARTPDAEALRTTRGALTYRELDRWAGHVAARVREAGAGPETPVAVCLGRGPGLVAALLGVLRAGAAYLPLDPAYPAEHRRMVLESVPAPIAIVEPALAGTVRAPGRRVLLADPWRFPERPAPAPPPSPGLPGSLAYVIPTSGSTGRPKGVAIEHRAVTALIDWAVDVYDQAELGGVLASTSVCFDLSAFELFVPLAAGGTVLLCENVLELPSLPWRDRVRLVNTVPSAMKAVLALRALPGTVTTVNLAGEPLPASLVEDLHREPGVRRVFNLYGPTEDTTYSTWELVPRAIEGRPAIGRPLPGGRAYVLDERLREVAPGMVGQVYLAGAGLARGYAGRAALTAASFVPDPFQAGRMYATGDVGRRLADGRLEHWGRADAQVKVRGMRIEPGEIESLLLSVPGVREAAVVAVGDGVERSLVACVTREPGAAAPLRDVLARRLPAHMVPGVFVEFDRLPRTPSGKVDRGRLVELAAGRREAAVDGGPQEPDGVRDAVARIWSEVLGVASVPPDATFFELGGHSLLASRVVARVRERLGVEVGISAVFDFPTVTAMARLLEERMAADVAADG